MHVGQAAGASDAETHASRLRLQNEAAGIIRERVIRENMGRPLATRQGSRVLAPTRALDGKALTPSMRSAEQDEPGSGLAALARTRPARTRDGAAPVPRNLNYEWSLHDRINHALAASGSSRQSVSAAIAAGIGLSTRAKSRRNQPLRGGQTLFSDSKSSPVSFGSTVALSTQDGRFLVVDPLSGEAKLQEPQYRWRERGVSPFSPLRVGPGDSRMIPSPFFLFQVVDLANPSRGEVVKLGEPAWLVVAGGPGEGNWRKGSVLGAHVQQGVELEQSSAAPYTAGALEAVRNDSIDLMAVPADFRERSLIE